MIVFVYFVHYAVVFDVVLGRQLHIIILVVFVFDIVYIRKTFTYVLVV